MVDLGKVFLWNSGLLHCDVKTVIASTDAINIFHDRLWQAELSGSLFRPIQHVEP